MSCHDVGKKTDHQGKRFRKDSEEFYQRHHRNRHLQPCRYFGPEDILPIGLGSEEVREQEGNGRQYQGNGNVTCYVRTTRENRNQPHQVVYQDKEEGSQQIGSITLVVFTDTPFDDILVDHHHERFDHSYPATRSSFLYRMLLVPAGTAQQDDHQYRTVDEESQYVLSDGDVQRTYLLTGSVPFHNLAVVSTSFGDIQAFIRFSLFQTGRREAVPARRAFHDDR